MIAQHLKLRLVAEEIGFADGDQVDQRFDLEATLGVALDEIIVFVHRADPAFGHARLQTRTEETLPFGIEEQAAFLGKKRLENFEFSRGELQTGPLSHLGTPSSKRAPATSNTRAN